MPVEVVEGLGEVAPRIEGAAVHSELLTAS
jgi:hypothetical protein